MKPPISHYVSPYPEQAEARAKLTEWALKQPSLGSAAKALGITYGVLSGMRCGRMQVSQRVAKIIGLGLIPYRQPGRQLGQTGHFDESLYAMTYEEIGRRMGFSPQRAKQICQNALDKLRQRHPEQLARLRQLVIEKQQLRRESWRQ